MDLQTLGMSPYGPATFAKCPLVPPGGEWDADFAVVGAPFDLGVGFRPGARWGPKSIRDMSVRFGSVGAGGGYWDLRSRTHRGRARLVDLGDVDVVPLDWEQNFERITEAVRGIVARGARPFVLGGDHAVTFPNVRGMEACGPLTIVHFDAHFDYRDEVAGVRYGHGNVLRRVRELAFVDQVVSFGVRSLRNRESDVQDFERDGNVFVPAWDIHEQGAHAFTQLLPRDRNVYITFDIDAMDPAIAPGTGTPEVGGMTFEQARAVLETTCARNRIVGMDMVEVNPHFDPSAITGLLAAQLMIEVIGFCSGG